MMFRVALFEGGTMISEAFIYRRLHEKTDTQLLKENVQVYPVSLAVCSDTVLHTAGESTV